MHTLERSTGGRLNAPGRTARLHPLLNRAIEIVDRHRRPEQRIQEVVIVNRYTRTSVLVMVLMSAAAMLWASGEIEGEAAAEKEMVVNWLGETVEKPLHGGVLNIATAFTAVDSWDQWRYHQTGTPFTAGVYQALGAIDIRTPIEDNQFQTSMFTWDQWYGIVAESWEQTDPLTITVNVRQGIKWQNKAPMNGRELTADDVVFTLHRQYGLGSGYTEKSPYLGDPHVEWLAGSTVTALDRYTVQVVTDVPRPFLAFAMMCFGCGLVIQPMEVIQEHGDLEDWRNAVGTGAWMLEDYVPGSLVQYSRNPDYWENDPRYPGENLQLPYADQLNYLMLPDESTRLAALRTGKIAQAGGQQQNIDWRTAEGLQSTNPELNFLEVAGSGGNAWGFSIRVDREPFDDIRVRQAIAMAVNTQEITEDYYGGNAEEYPYPALLAVMAETVHQADFHTSRRRFRRRSAITPRRPRRCWRRLVMPTASRPTCRSRRSWTWSCMNWRSATWPRSASKSISGSWSTGCTRTSSMPANTTECSLNMIRCRICRRITSWPGIRPTSGGMRVA